MRLRQKLVGSWRMVDWAVTSGEGPTSYLPPLGFAEECGGTLIYSDDGMMSAFLSRLDRSPFAEGSLDGGTDAERLAASHSIIAYGGRYEVDERRSEVAHIVEYATLPNLCGQRMMRVCIFDGDLLKLDTPEMLMGGQIRRSYIRWRRTCPPLPDNDPNGQAVVRPAPKTWNADPSPRSIHGNMAK